MPRVSRRTLVIVPLLSLEILIVPITAAHADLDQYLKKPEPAYAWRIQSTDQTPAGSITSIELTSQVWQGITWKHVLTIYEPKGVPASDAMLLFITGGGTGSRPSDDDHQQGFQLGKVCGARVAVLHQVPNQPLLGDKTEDTLIAETFVRYLETHDENWPLLFPMVKSAVKALDAIQEWSRSTAVPARRFVVTGASKRGWTTWLTGAVDDRVIAIAPMVIVMLNLGSQGPNQLKVWGKYSEQIEDYVQRGLMERAQTKEGAALWKMVDPFTYRDRLTKPKLLINGTNDRYWTLDALDLYWDGLAGPKNLIELPNAGHGLEQNRDWALNGLGAFYRLTVAGRSLPRIDWKKVKDQAGRPTLEVHADPAPRAARLWQAESATRDFRESTWTSSPLAPGPALRVTPDLKGSNQIALMVELEYELEGHPFHLTTGFFEPRAPAPTAPQAP